MLAIRRDYINIYYRGGNILRIEELSKGLYKTYFDPNFNKSAQGKIPCLPATITNQDDAQKWGASFNSLKNFMDEFFSKYGKSEREFQQLLARENNLSSISNETEYFVSDIEVSYPFARFDIVAIRWLASERKGGSNCKAALIEIKYSDGAIRGKAGLIKHLKDMEKLVSDTKLYTQLLNSMEKQFNQLDALGLLKFNKGTSNAEVKLAHSKPEVILILANHNPRSSSLYDILSDSEFDKYGQSDHFDLRFYVASFAGYGLHADCMHSLAKFRDLCKVKARLKSV